ncbi:MAG: DCC1-like thiol-disulfide oxidoreductase family protein [Halarcobacter sp.]
MKVFLYYDGDCPFCKRYADILKLKKCFDIKICDARTDLSWKKSNKDIILDDGVILIYEDRYYQGVEALDMLLSICKYDGIFFSFQKFIFSNKILGFIVYNCLKFFRKVTLWIKSLFI